MRGPRLVFVGRLPFLGGFGVIGESFINILCQEKKRLIAEYALRGMSKAIGVSEYQLTRLLPKKLKGCLPTIDEIEKELGIS